MIMRLSLLFLLTFGIACGKDSGQSETAGFNSNTIPEESLNPITLDDPLPPEAETFAVNISYINFTAAQRQKYEEAVAIVKKVVASEEFKYEVLSHSFNEDTIYFENGGRSNSAIYQHILHGNEKLQPTKNNAIDVEVELYYENSTTVGYTYPSSRRIWVNTKYFNANPPSYIAGNLFHEWLHKLGYGHSSTYSVSRDYTVPYGIGQIIRTLGLQYE